MNEEIIKIHVKYKDRIDKYIANNSDISRNDAQTLIENGAVYVGTNQVRKLSFNVFPDQIIEITETLDKEIHVTPEKMDLDIVYEDDDLLVVNKPSGMVVHPAPGHHSGTLINGLLYRYQKLSTLNGNVRPGIVHRIDKDTSGLLLVAKNDFAHAKLSEELRDHKIQRYYYAWVEGRFENKVIHINLPIGRSHTNRQKMAVQDDDSKEAITHIFVEKVLEHKSLVRCELETGRTHQIRVHLAHIGHPVIGDPVYGHSIDDFGQRLHAFKLVFNHPRTGKQIVCEVKPPKEFDL